MRVLLCLASLLLLPACQETFVAPPAPDLYKAPYDFSVGPGQEDLAVPDLGSQLDLRTNKDGN